MCSALQYWYALTGCNTALNLFDMLYFAVHYKKKKFHKCASDLSSGSCHVLIMILLIVSLIVMYCHVFIRMFLMVLFQVEANKNLELKNV